MRWHVAESEYRGVVQVTVRRSVVINLRVPGGSAGGFGLVCPRRFIMKSDSICLALSLTFLAFSMPVMGQGQSANRSTNAAAHNAARARQEDFAPVELGA